MNRTPNFLVVDDNEPLANNLQELLHGEGYSASVAFDGGTALSLCRGASFDVILVDIRLPDMDGLRLQERLSAVSDADVIIITGYGTLENAAEAVRRKRIVGYETKPLDMARLMAFVRQVISRRRAQADLERALGQSRRYASECKALLDASKSVIQTDDLEHAARRVFDICAGLLGATAGYVALLSEGGEANDVLFLESGGRECTVDPDLPMPLRGLRNEAYTLGRVVYDNDFSNSPWMAFMPEGHATLDNVLFAPLKMRGRTVGVMGLANKPGPFTDEDARMAAGFSEIASFALHNASVLTSLENALASAEGATRRKSEFLAHAAHEIRSPMNAIVGAARILNETPLDPEQREHLDTMRSCSDILLAVINDLLDFSKIEAGKIELEKVDFTPDALVREVVGILSIRAREKGIRVRPKVDGTAHRRFSGDMGRLRQVLLNLTANAVKFTETGEVLVSFSSHHETETGATLQFSVRDTGIGISGERLDALFEPFSQTDASISRRFGGTGLGLTISKNIVEMMGGDIRVRSEPGGGSTFWFTVTLEKAGDPESRDAAAAAEAPSVEKTGEVRVLLAEDNPFNQKIMQIILNNLGIQSDVAGNGREAIRMLGEKRYDLILMDIQMPKMDGIDATRAIRESASSFQNIPIVALTAHALPEQRDIWMAAGMDGYLIKPVKPERLRETIYSHIGKTEDSE